MKIFDKIQNLLESWLDSKIPGLILKIPVDHIRQVISHEYKYTEKNNKIHKSNDFMIPKSERFQERF